MIIGRVRSSSPCPHPRLPAHLVQRDPAPRIQLNSLLLQQELLDQLPTGGGTGAYPSRCVHHPMPRHNRSIRQSVEGIANLTRVSSQAGERRNLSVRGHPALGNPPDHAINPLIAHPSD